MARKLTKEEMEKSKADFDPPIGAKPEEKKSLKKELRKNLSPKKAAPAEKQEQEPEPKKKTKAQQQREAVLSYWQEVKRRDDEAKAEKAAQPKHAGGRPKKAEEVSVRSFRLSDRTMQRLRILAAFDNVSVADIITKLADKAKVPGLD